MTVPARPVLSSWMGVRRMGDKQPTKVLFFESSGVQLAAFEVPLRIPAHLVADLTDAERDVCACIVAGDGYAAIATRRGTSVRTVANQVQVVFRKLGVSTRNELVALTAAHPETDDDQG